MGVQLEDNELSAVFEGSMAEKAGWQEGDVILSINGVEVSTQNEVVGELQKGGLKKTVKLLRGDTEVESVLDYTDTPSEKARQAAAARKAADKQPTRKE